MNQAKTLFACASLLGILLASQTITAKAAEITVCPSSCDQTTVQAGIDAAVFGDTVVVGTPGHTENGISETYIVDNIQMKEGVSVVSEGPITETYIDYTNPFVQGVPFDKADEYREKKVLKRATLTILQGLGDDTVVSFPAGADNAVLDGFIVENIDSSAMNIPLINVEDCSPTIRNNIVRDNEGAVQSGGIDVEGGTEVATPLIQDNVIHYVNGHGIGVYSKSAPTIVDNEIFTTPPVIDSTPAHGEPFRDAPGIGFHDDSVATILGNHIFLNGAGGIGSRGPLEPDGVTALHGVYDLPGYAFDIRGNTIHHNSSSAGIGIFGKPGEEYPTTEVSCVIGGPDPNNINDRNTLHDNYMGVRIGFWDDSTSKSLGTVVIQNTDIEFSRQPGLMIVNTTSAGINHNTVHANKKVGILVNKNKDLTIENNTVTDNGQASTTQGGGIWLRNNDTLYTVLVQNNQISSNVAGGMRVEGYYLKADIKENLITNNGRGGIKIMRVTDLNIIDNEIADNARGGVHTGTFQAGGGNIPPGFPVIIRGNKVHDNGSGDFGGGIDVRHASGTIENNIVYKNHRGGIRFGDWISAINHNTVVKNGLISDLGGGIVYDDLDGEVNDLPSGFPDVAIPIRNNILVGNALAGINTGTLNGGDCSDWLNFRDYNLLSSNNGAAESCSGEPWCERPQLALCDGNQYEIFAAPQFVDQGSDDYHLLATSPAVDAGDPLFPVDVQPPGLGASTADMGAYGGEYGINW